MKRRDFIFRASSTTAMALAGCGGSSEATSVAAAPAPALPPAPSPAQPASPSGPAAPWVPSGTGLPTLTLHPGQTGTAPYLATAFPLEGAVPNGQTIVSDDDITLSASIISRWPDGSASVVVLSGEATVVAGQARRIAVRAGTAAQMPLTATLIAGLLQEISCDFGAAGAASMKNFASPDRIWWANERVICARYRLPIGNDGLEALIDVHAFSSKRALIELVIENGRLDANSQSPTAPSTKIYSDAVVSLNGQRIATVSSPAAGMKIPNARRSGQYAGGHEPFRAWYCSAWVGGDPKLDVTHDSVSLQSHPWFFRPAEASSENLQRKYSQPYDTYVPWAACRLRVPGMDGGGDDEEIALFTECQTDYFLSGNVDARRAVLSTGLACLSADFHWRHGDGQVPTEAQVAGKNTQNGKWPRIKTEPRWGGGSTNDGSHIPAIGLVPFLCHPSPCFIESVQKEFVWNHTNYNSLDGSHSYDQTRSRAWRLRNYAIAIFLTPDSDVARKAGYRGSLVASMRVINRFLDKDWNVFRVLYDLSADDPSDHSNTRPGHQVSFFMHNFCLLSFHSIAGAKVLTGADGVAWNQMTDRMTTFPLRWINDASEFEWRVIPYQPTIGTRQGTAVIATPANLSGILRQEMTAGTPPTGPGPWMTLSSNNFDWGKLPIDPVAGTSYPSQYFAALCVAVERAVPGASAAWDKVVTNGGISNFDTWRRGYRTSPRFNRWPRNK